MILPLLPLIRAPRVLLRLPGILALIPIAGYRGIYVSNRRRKYLFYAIPKAPLVNKSTL